jgi:hypothetical protein
MKLSLFAVVAGAVLLGACQHPRLYPKSVDPARPQVRVENGRIQLVPDVMVFRTDQRNVVVTWQLPAGARLRFADNGIVIEGEVTEQLIKGQPPSVALNPRQNEIVDCKRSADGLSFSCLNRHTRTGVYKYTIRVLQDGRIVERDPFVMNM